MSLHDSQPADEETGARSTVADRAVHAGERLLDASSKIGNAYADAYQEAVISMADFREKLTDATPVDWRKLAPHPGPMGTSAAGNPLQDAALTATRVNEQLLSASKQLGLAYADACEQAMLSFVEMGEQAAAGSENEWLRSAGSTRAGMAREITKSYVDAARRLLG